MTIRIVTDSACDIPPELLAQYHIRVIPAYINFELESVADDGISISKDEFYERMAQAQQLPKTSAPPPGVSEAILREALKDADHVIVVHVSGKLSGLIEASRIAARNIDPDRITVFDSESVSLGGGWMALIAAEMAADGADAAAILGVIEAAKTRSSLWAAPTTLDYLRRSGRVNSVVAGLGEMLQIKPIITVKQGEIVLHSRVRTFKKVFSELEDYCRQAMPLERLAVIHLNSPETGEKMLDCIKDIAPPDKTLMVNASAAIGVHFGPGGVGVAVLRK